MSDGSIFSDLSLVVPSREYEHNQNSFFTLITFLRYLTSFTISKSPIFETHLSPTMAPSVLFFKKERNKIFRVIGLFTKELPCHLSFRLNGVFLPTENNSDISHYKPPLLHYVNNSKAFCFLYNLFFQYGTATGSCGTISWQIEGLFHSCQFQTNLHPSQSPSAYTNFTIQTFHVGLPPKVNSI